MSKTTPRQNSGELEKALQQTVDHKSTRQGLKTVARDATAKSDTTKEETPAYRSALKQEEFSAEDQLESECVAFAEHVNNALSGHESLQHERYLPVTGTTMIEKFKDGVLLGYLLGEIRQKLITPGQLVKHQDLTQIGKPHSKVMFEVTANHNLFVNAAKKAGIVVVNIGSEDILKGTPHLVLGLVWQIIRAHLLSDINIVSHPELIRLLNKGEGLDTLLSLPADQVLLRWVNYHLTRAGSNQEIRNFSSDISDSSCYATLIAQIAPKASSEEDFEEVLSIPLGDPSDEAAVLQQKEVRATRLLQTAAKIGCRRFVTAKDIVTGHARLNLAFVATLFNAYIGIQLPSEEEIADIFGQLDVLQEKVSMMRGNLEEKDQAMVALSQSHDLALSQQSLTFEGKLSDASAKHQDEIDSARTEAQHAIQIWTSKRNAVVKQHQEFCQDLKNALIQSVDIANHYEANKLELSVWPPKGDKSLDRLNQENETMTLAPQKTKEHNAPKEDWQAPLPPSSPPPESLVEEARPAGVSPSNSIELSHVAPIDADQHLSADDLAKAAELSLAMLPAALKTFVMQLVEDNNQLRHRVHITEAIMAQKNKLNELMGDKIKEYTEEMIKKKKKSSK